jgi:hypothetical protein
MAFIILCCDIIECLMPRPVNSGVRHASHKIGSRALCNAGQKADVKLNDILFGRSNNSFNASGNSIDFMREACL